MGWVFDPKTGQDVFVGTRKKSNRKTKTAKAKSKNPCAVSLGRLGGLKGGKSRASKLSGIERSEIASKAAKARWRKSKKKK